MRSIRTWSSKRAISIDTFCSTATVRNGARLCSSARNRARRVLEPLGLEREQRVQRSPRVAEDLQERTFGDDGDAAELRADRFTRGQVREQELERSMCRHAAQAPVHPDTCSLERARA
jgi:hypothetical protein